MEWIDIEHLAIWVMDLLKSGEVLKTPPSKLT